MNVSYYIKQTKLSRQLLSSGYAGSKNALGLGCQLVEVLNPQPTLCTTGGSGMRVLDLDR
jgi:hypothetical protein